MTTKMKIGVLPNDIAPVTLVDAVYLGDGTTATLKDKIKKLENNNNISTGSTEHFKGLFSDFGNSYINENLESGIYLVKQSNLPSVLNPPIKNDFYLIHQKIFTDFKWAFQIAYDYTNPAIIYTRRCLCGSPANDGRQGDWQYIGINSQFAYAKQKTLCTMGDSILAKWTGEGDINGVQPFIINRLGLNVKSIAHSGAKMASFVVSYNQEHEPYSFAKLSQTHDFSQYDYLLVGYGTNDCAHNLPVGDVDSTDITTVAGSMNTGLAKIYESNPNIQIFFITPIFRNDVEGVMKTLKKYRDIIIEVCEKWNIPYFDGYYLSGMNIYNCKYTMTGDYLHPDTGGYNLYGVRLAEWLRQFV